MVISEHCDCQNPRKPPPRSHSARTCPLLGLKDIERRIGTKSASQNSRDQSLGFWSKQCIVGCRRVLPAPCRCGKTFG